MLKVNDRRTDNGQRVIRLDHLEPLAQVLNKRAMMALDRSPDLCNVICHANHINSFCGQVLADNT